MLNKAALMDKLGSTFIFAALNAETKGHIAVFKFIDFNANVAH